MRRWLAAAAVASCLACGGDPTGAIPTCGEATRVDVGETVVGALVEGDDRFADAFIDYYSLRLSTAADLTVTMTSTELDPLLLVFDTMTATAEPVFDSIGEPPGAEETATLSRTFAAGCHLFGASSWYPDSTGAYTASIEAAGPESARQ